LLAVAAWDNRPGAWNVTQPVWPASSALARATSAYTLLLFAHPLCPCTLASLAELERILARRQDRISARVVFSTLDDDAPGTRESDGWKKAATIPGVRVDYDARCVEARRFGARTSGAVLLFDPSGRLVFRGGITAARGHQGDNTGEEAVLALVDHRAAAANLPVFGCSLFDPDPADDARPERP
jgi:hypothetical protein